VDVMTEEACAKCNTSLKGTSISSHIAQHTFTRDVDAGTSFVPLVLHDFLDVGRRVMQ
jgi:hypothetical protein